MRLRVLSYNIHKGYNWRGTKILEELRAGIRQLEADLVFLQEVGGMLHDFHDESALPNPSTQLEYLAHEIWDHHAYGKNSVHSRGHHGNAILSRFALEDVINYDISTNKLEKRGLLTCRLNIEEKGQNILLCCTHYDLLEAGRWSQAKWMSKWLSENTNAKEKILFAGDFNDWNQKLTPLFSQNNKLSEIFWSTTRRHARSFPSAMPLLKLDRIYFRGLDLLNQKVISGRPWNRLSDHAALVAEFDIQGQTSEDLP